MPSTISHCILETTFSLPVNNTGVCQLHLLSFHTKHYTSERFQKLNGCQQKKLSLIQSPHHGSPQWSRVMLRYLTRWIVRGSGSTSNFRRDSTNEDDMTMTDLTRIGESRTVPHDGCDETDADDDDETVEEGDNYTDEVLFRSYFRWF